jgi:hypothetical protein
MSSNDRKMMLQKQLMQQDTPALHDYLILRFGADPMFREVMREDMLYGMVGTSITVCAQSVRVSLGCGNGHEMA